MAAPEFAASRNTREILVNRGITQSVQIVRWRTPDTSHFFLQDEFIVAISADFVRGNVDVDFLAPLPDLGIHKSVPELGFLD